MSFIPVVLQRPIRHGLSSQGPPYSSARNRWSGKRAKSHCQAVAMILPLLASTGRVDVGDIASANQSRTAVRQTTDHERLLNIESSPVTGNSEVLRQDGLPATRGHKSCSRKSPLIISKRVFGPRSVSPRDRAAALWPETNANLLPAADFFRSDCSDFDSSLAPVVIAPKTRIENHGDDQRPLHRS